MSKFKKGADAAKEASKSVQFDRTHYFSMKDQEEMVVRFLSDADEWITVDQHNFVPTKPKPADFKGDKWPNVMGTVCRKTKLEGGETLFDDCFICDHMKKPDGKPYRASARTWALAVEREEVKDENGNTIGFRDKTREVAVTDKEGKPTGETKQEKAVMVVNQGYKNFFSTLQGFAGRYGTVLDRDYYIKRDGDDTSTTYHIVPLDPLDIEHPETGEEVRFDLRDPALLKRYADAMPDLDTIVEGKADQEFYDRFFVPGSGAAASSDNAQGGESEGGQNNDVSEERVKNLAERVRGYSQGSDSEAPAEATSGGPKALD